jgi:hypothetical protein
MLGVSTEKRRDLLGDSHFYLRILLKPTVKKRVMKVWARFTVMKRSGSEKKKGQSSDKLNQLSASN